MDAARAAITALISSGVRDLVLCPGSRSAPLAYLAAAAEQAGLLRVHVRIDERSAGFLALGLALGSGVPAGDGSVGQGPHPRLTPVAVVTTSGTATANLHPAVMEAHHSNVPVLVLTADRPQELHGTGANQTTGQSAIFGRAVRWQADIPAPSGRHGEQAEMSLAVARAVAIAAGFAGVPGPVHLNIAFREPLTPEVTPGRDALATVIADLIAVAAQPAPQVVLPPRHSGVWDGDDDWRTGGGTISLDALRDESRTVVVAGTGAGPVAARLAEARSWPLLAEVTSGVGPSRRLVPSYRAALAESSALVSQVVQVVVVGRPTLSREVMRLLAGPAVRVVLADPAGSHATYAWPDPTRTAAIVLPGIPESWLTGAQVAADRTSWCTSWEEAGAAAGTRHTDVDGPGVAQAVLEASLPGDVLVAGASSPVRDLDASIRPDELPWIVSNRGVSGIDGTISTAVGVATSSRAAGRVRALMGDLTFLHDINGLHHGAGEPAADLQIVVVNDKGGSIFSGLEHGRVGATGPLSAAVLQRAFTTPHLVDLTAVCRAFGVAHEAVTTRKELLAALVAPSLGLSVVEVRVDPDRHTS